MLFLTRIFLISPDDQHFIRKQREISFEIFEIITVPIINNNLYGTILLQDVQYVDIDHMDERKDFTKDLSNFPGLNDYFKT